jgi:thiol-disulfide isomerase/thioredoxin
MAWPSRETVLSWARSLAFAALIALLVRELVRSGSGPATDTVAADFALPRVTSAAAPVSRDLSLHELRGKPVLIEAFTAWCSACRRSAPALREAASVQRDKPVHFLSVMLEATPEDAQRVKTQWGIQHDLLIDDGSFARSYSISMLPTWILIDAEGKVRKVVSGTADRGDIESWLSAL